MPVTTANANVVTVPGSVKGISIQKNVLLNMASSCSCQAKGVGISVHAGTARFVGLQPLRTPRSSEIWSGTGMWLQVGGRWLKHTYQAGQVSKWLAAKVSSSITKNLVFPSCNDLVLPGLLAIDNPLAAAHFPPKPAAGVPPSSPLSMLNVYYAIHCIAPAEEEGLMPSFFQTGCFHAPSVRFHHNTQW